MRSRDFLKKEKALAERFAVRKLDVLLQKLRCPQCEREGLRIQRYQFSQFVSTEAIEALMLREIRATFRAQCVECGTEELKGDGKHHLFLLYSERRRAHLGLALHLTREKSGRTRVRRQLWLLPLDGKPEEIDESSDALEDFWLDSTLRRAVLEPNVERARRGLRDLARVLPQDPIVAREQGLLLEEIGDLDGALSAYLVSLGANDEQVDVLRAAARLEAARHDEHRASELLARAFDIAGDAESLTELTEALYRARRFGALEVAANELDALEPGTTRAAKARVAAGSALDLATWARHWQSLHARAEAAGERWSEQIAAHWVSALASAPPSWPGDATAAAYRRALADHFAELGWQVEDRPAPLVVGEASAEVDLELLDPEGQRHVLWLVEPRPRVAVAHSLTCSLRALREDADRGDAGALILCRQPLPYTLLRYCANVTDTAIDLSADADTTLSTHDENISALVWVADRYFGATLDLTTGSLDELARVLARLRDDGFGGATFAFRCQAASYVGETVRRVVPAARWVEGAPNPYPRRLVVRETTLDILGQVEMALRTGSAEPLHRLVRLAAEADTPKGAAS